MAEKEYSNWDARIEGQGNLTGKDPVDLKGGGIKITVAVNYNTPRAEGTSFRTLTAFGALADGIRNMFDDGTLKKNSRVVFAGRVQDNINEKDDTTYHNYETILDSFGLSALWYGSESNKPKSRRSSRDDDDDDEDEAPRSRRRRRTVEDDEDDAPKPRRRRSEPEDEAEEEAPRRRRRRRNTDDDDENLIDD